MSSHMMRYLFCAMTNKFFHFSHDSENELDKKKENKFLEPLKA